MFRVVEIHEAAYLIDGIKAPAVSDDEAVAEAISMKARVVRPIHYESILVGLDAVACSPAHNAAPHTVTDASPAIYNRGSGVD